MARTNGSDDPASSLSKREAAAVQFMACLLREWAHENPGDIDKEGKAPESMKHMAFLAAGAANALYDELSS